VGAAQRGAPTAAPFDGAWFRRAPPIRAGGPPTLSPATRPARPAGLATLAAGVFHGRQELTTLAR
jgi:hypothetical protein